ncbi:MAG: (2Fe-2S) ferredoxin domain-containing protein [Planctomycetes bacterium]|nr:(2Fe-2S) ferredoxin domain-containing protein [Planctomycetota bacterium]MCC7169023.1 (2Fe-2S) ferredoxin domain-containing protein [Planctomycetota bacterium]
MNPFRRHFLVCITNRPPSVQHSCGARGATELLAAMQKAADRKGLRELFGTAVTGTTCLGLCETGPNVVVYPENLWYGGVQPENAREIIESHGVEGVAVARLLHPDVDRDASENAS